jgi:hypothetical protein
LSDHPSGCTSNPFHAFQLKVEHGFEVACRSWRDILTKAGGKAL